MTTPFSKRVEILGDWWAFAYDNDEMRGGEWISEYSDILSLCLAINAKWVAPIDNGRLESNVNIVWDRFCEWFGVDNYGDYDSLQQFLDFANE